MTTRPWLGPSIATLSLFGLTLACGSSQGNSQTAGGAAGMSESGGTGNGGAGNGGAGQSGGASNPGDGIGRYTVFELDVPFAEAYLEGVDLPQRQVRMKLPEGMLEINAPLTAEEKAQAKTFDEQLKNAKASVQAAPDGDLKAEAERDIEAAERLFADGHTERAEAALRQAVAVVPPKA